MYGHFKKNEILDVYIQKVIPISKANRHFHCFQPMAILLNYR